MKKSWLTISGLALAALMFAPAILFAQKGDKDSKVKKEKDEVEQIIITKKGEGTDKVIVEINGDNVTINGKPVDEYKDKNGNLTIRRNKINRNVDVLLSNPGSRGGVWNFNADDHRYENLFNQYSDMAMLGVTTEKSENGGVKVNDVTKESAAEKIGLKEGDIITKIDDKTIGDPDELSEAIRNHKPGDKVKVTFLRDKKEQKETAELTKWKGMDAFGGLQGQNFDMHLGDMNFDKIIPNIQSIPQLRGYSQNWNWSGNSPKLGLSVQDTDDGKGVKVLEVDEESNAAKAGIKENDIITEVDGTTVNGTDDMVKMIKASREKVSVMMKLQRNGKTQNIEVKMPRKIKTADL